MRLFRWPCIPRPGDVTAWRTLRLACLGQHCQSGGYSKSLRRQFDAGKAGEAQARMHDHLSRPLAYIPPCASAIRIIFKL
jgi:hypothetical protein